MEAGKKEKKIMHFVEELFSREIGGLRHKYFKKKTRDSCIRQSRKLLRYVVLSNRRKFVKLPTIVSNGQVIYEDGKLYLGHKGTNSVDCHAIRDGGRGCESLSKALCTIYGIPLKPKWKSQVKKKNT